MILLLALLLAQEKVVMVAKDQQKPGFFAKLGEKLSGAVHRLYEKEDAQVAQGNALAAEGKVEEAMKEYEGAAERLPDDPRLALNRSSALLKLDPEKAPQALGEASKAMQSPERALQALGAYDAALATEAMGKPDEAMKAYAQALKLDPDDEDSKVNLELLLRTEEERKQKQQQGTPQEDPQKQKEAGKDDKEKQQGGEQQQEQQKKDAGDKKEEEKKEQAQQQQQKGQEQQQKPDEKKKEQEAQAEQKPVDRSEAERLLDALRSGEKNLQAWRFAKDKKKDARRSESEKDW